MRAMVINRFGGIEVFEEMNLPKPHAIAGHVVIKVIATSVNPLDYKLRQGYLPDLITTFPVVLHGDVAGVIEEIGEGVHDFAVGDEVYGCIGGLLNMNGALAEYVMADANLIALKPKTLSFTEAAALPLISLTAWEGLITYANVQKDQTVLIHGGTGGVGHIALQLAKSLNAKVYTTCSSEEKMERAKQLGADGLINYKKDDVESYVAKHTHGAGFDIVFDTVGGNNLIECMKATALFGKVISILAAGQYDLTPAFMKGLTIHTVLQPLPLITGIKRKHYQTILINIAKLVDAGKIRPLIDDHQFMINQVGNAHAHLENGHAIGKVVLTHF
jgi:NADPH2:quinone reductase